MRKKNIFLEKRRERVGEYSFEKEANHSNFIQTTIRNIFRFFKNSNKTKENNTEKITEDTIMYYPDAHKNKYLSDLNGFKSTKDIPYVDNKNDEICNLQSKEMFTVLYGPPPYYKEIDENLFKTFEEKMNEIKDSIEKLNFDIEKTVAFHNKEEKQKYISIIENINDELGNLEKNGLFDFEIILCGEESKTDENETRRLLIEKRSADVNDQKQRVNELLLRLTNVK